METISNDVAPAATLPRPTVMEQMIERCKAALAEDAAAAASAAAGNDNNDQKEATQ
jgi:hypothetical protein